MKPFRFPLKRVLDIRSDEEGQAQELYARAVRLVEQFNERRRQVENSLEANLEECRSECSGPTKSGRVVQLRTMLEVLREKLKAMEPEAAELKVVLDEKWQELVIARQKREAMDKLQDRKKEAHEREMAREEQLGLDEMISLRESRGSTKMM